MIEKLVLVLDNVKETEHLIMTVKEYRKTIDKINEIIDTLSAPLPRGEGTGSAKTSGTLSKPQEVKCSDICCICQNDCKGERVEDTCAGFKAKTLSKPSVVSEQTEFLERVSKKAEEMLAIMEKHNIVIDNLDDKMQKFAFTVYSELVQLSQEAKSLLES